MTSATLDKSEIDRLGHSKQGCHRLIAIGVISVFMLFFCLLPVLEIFLIRLDFADMGYWAECTIISEGQIVRCYRQINNLKQKHASEFEQCKRQSLLPFACVINHRIGENDEY